MQLRIRGEGGDEDHGLDICGAHLVIVLHPLFVVLPQDF